MKAVLSILLCLSFLISKSQITVLTKSEVKSDLAFFKKLLETNSSYVYLNGYDFNTDIEKFQQSLKDTISLTDFGYFLSRTIGKIGDRHSSVSSVRGADSLYMPFVYAPYNGRVLVLKRNKDRGLNLLTPEFPYLKAVNSEPINVFLEKVLPEEITAPKNSYFTRAIRELRDIQKIYSINGEVLPQEIKLTLSDSSLQRDTLLEIKPLIRKHASRPLDEKFESEYLLVSDEDYNEEHVIDSLFNFEDKIGYFRIPLMVSKEDAPHLFEKIKIFMSSIQDNSIALILDIRSNGGGTRDLTYEMAKYFVPKDSIYVINATKQRAPIPLSQDFIERLNGRYLYNFSDLDKREQTAVSAFLKEFKPMYMLDETKYSEYYFGLFNGKKLSNNSFYYSKPVFILVNEKSFSAASVFASVFKGLPNIRIVGVTTDGSSGNSDRFELPNSKIRIKLSTMVSFQKDGKILDGYGTEPDIYIERDINQVLWNGDSQLRKLKSLILENDF